MVAAFDYTLFGKGGAAPSIDTAMHGLVDAAHVDHLHPDSGIAFATAADGEALTTKVFGDRVVWVPWRRPGLPARSGHRRDQGREPAGDRHASSAATASRRGATPRDEAEANSLWIIETAQAYIDANGRHGALRRRPWRATGLCPRPSAAPRPPHWRPHLRGARVGRPAQVGHFTDARVVLDFLASAEHPRLAALGTSCPDHFLRTKVKPMVLDLPADGLGRGVGRAARRAARRSTAPTTRRTTTGTRPPDSPAIRGADPPSC